MMTFSLLKLSGCVEIKLQQSLETLFLDSSFSPIIEYLYGILLDTSFFPPRMQSLPPGLLHFCDRFRFTVYA